jgi:hypothetical protein
MTRTLMAGIAAALLGPAVVASFVMAKGSDQPASCDLLSHRLTGFEALASDPAVPSQQRTALTADVAVAREWIDAGCSGDPPDAAAALVHVLEQPQSAGTGLETILSQTDAHGVSEE